MIEGIYALCALTSVVCAALLLQGYLRTRVDLLLWSSICFVGLAINNVILWLDLVGFPDVDLAWLRAITATAALGAMVVGLVWEA